VSKHFFSYLKKINYFKVLTSCVSINYRYIIEYKKKMFKLLSDAIVSEIIH